MGDAQRNNIFETQVADRKKENKKLRLLLLFLCSSIIITTHMFLHVHVWCMCVQFVTGV